MVMAHSPVNVSISAVHLYACVLTGILFDG